MKRRAAIVGLLVLMASAAAIASSTPQRNGRFALFGGTPHIVSKFWATEGVGSNYTLHVQQFDKDVPIKAYDVDMQHHMHVVVVRDDFATFAYEHPSFNAQTGVFQAAFRKEPHHRFYVYADSMPKGIGRQVFRFVMDSDGLEAGVRLPKAATGPDAQAGPYTVAIGKTTLRANAPLTIPLTIASGDHPAENLVPYLGAPAHVVLIDVNRLTYAHVHPAVRGQKAPHPNVAGPFLQLELPALPASTYATWVQIAGGKAHTVYTARFNLVVE